MAAVGQHSLPASLDSARLYERHYRRVFSYCLWRLGKREDAEDAAQTTFLNAHRALGQGTTPQSESSWLLTIAHNVCLARWRSQKTRPPEFSAEPESLALLAAPEHDTQLVRRLQAALAGLPETQRRAFLLREWQGLSYAEIATELDTTETAVAALVFRARRALMDSLGDERRTGRLVGGLNVGSALSWLKSLLGGTAAKLAVAGAVVGAAGIAAGVPLVVHHHTRAANTQRAVPVAKAPNGLVAKHRVGGRGVRATVARQRAHRPASRPPVTRTGVETKAPASGEPAPAPAASGQPPVSSAGAPPTQPVPSPPSQPSPPAVKTPPVSIPTPDPPNVTGTATGVVGGVVGAVTPLVPQVPTIAPPALPTPPPLPKLP